MSSLLPTLLAGAAGIALGGALWQMGSRIVTLEKRKEESAATQDTAGRNPRTSKPMFSGLYKEPSASPLSAVTSVPGGAWLGAALILALLAVVTTTFSRAETPAKSTTPDSGLIRLHGRVDSLARVVRQLHDSLTVVKAPTVGEKAKPAATRIARRPASDSKAVLPAAPPPPPGAPVQ